MSNEKKKIRKKLLGFDVGMTYYSTLEEDEEDITIPFVESLYITSNKIVELLPEYLECLKRNECPEVLGIDLDVMTNTAYWMKNDKLQHDMEALNDLTLHERGIEFAYKGFKPATTLELYEAIRKNVEDMVRMLSDVRRLLIAAPPALYGNFYRQQKSLYDEQKTEAAYEQWKREVGVVTFDILVDKQALEVAEFLKRKILRFSQMPSKREIDRVDINKLKEHLPIGYELPEEFPKCYARFMRFATQDGDILSINANSYGKYLHQFYHRLSDDEQQVLIGLDLMLQRIHRDMKAYPQPLPKGREKESGKLPEVLATEAAMALWRKAQAAGYVDANYQPLISRTQAALLADYMAERLDIKDKWKVFEELWNRKNMRSDYNLALRQQQSLDFQDSLKQVLYNMN